MERAEPAASDALLLLLRRAGRHLLRLPRWAGGLLALGWMAVIWRLSASALPATPVGPFWATVSNLAHAPLFGLLALLLVLALPRDAGRGGWPRLGLRESLLVLGLVAGYGLVDELHQALHPERDASARDVLTDAVGGACTLWVAAYLGRATARAAGLHARLAAGVLLCVAAAFLAALEP